LDRSAQSRRRGACHTRTRKFPRFTFGYKALALQTGGIVSIGDGTTALFDPSDDPFPAFSDAARSGSVRKQKCWLGRAQTLAEEVVMARKNVLSAFDTLDPDTEALDPNLFSSPSLLNNASPTAPTPPTEVILPKAAAQHLPDVALNNLPGFITVPTVESALTTSASLLAGDPPDPTDCPRSITFTLPGAPGVTIHGEEGQGLLAGDLVFTVTVNNTASLDGNLGALFLQFNDTTLKDLNVTGPDVAFFKTGDDTILNLGNGLNMSGAVTTGFDIGIALSSPSNHVDITTTTFVISDPVQNLSLDDLHQAGETSQVGVRVTAVGAPAGPRHGSEKLTGFAPFPPTAVDDFYTTNEDDAITVNVTANDQDANANGFPLTVDHIVSQPTYGTVTINADGTLTYTPFLDAVIDGTPINTDKDTFQYCVRDALGGEDNATVTVTVIPEAEPPSISLSAASGASAGETLITVTAISEDFGTRTQGSDFIQSLQLSLTGNFLGVTFSDDQGLLDPSTNIITTFGQPGTFTDVIHVNTAALNGQNFNLDDVLTITAVAAETEKPAATASASKDQPIQIDYSQQSTNVDFTATNQSIWDTGGAFTTDFNKFLGIDTGASTTLGGTFLGAGISVGASFHIKTGFQMDLSINSGSFNADLPYNITFNDAYNKTTDTLEIDPFDTALSGGHISTLGPNGSFSLDFVFDAMAKATITLSYVIGSTSASVGTALKTTLPIVHFNSTTAKTTIPIPPNGPIATLTFAWPNVNTSGTGGPGTISSVGTSNPIVNLDLDLIALALAALGISPDPLKGSVLGVSYDLLSADISGGIDVQQKFDLNELGLTPTLTLEDGTVEPFTFGTPLLIPNASTHDSNSDGTLAMSLDLTPDANLHNNTSLAAQLGFGVTALKIDGFDPLHFTTTIPLGNLGSIYNKSFPVNFQSATVNFSQPDLQHA
jgi:Bacterial cadherin-like domain